MNDTRTNFEKQVTILIALSVMMIVPVYFFGWRPLFILGVAVLTAIICEFFLKKWCFRFAPAQSVDLSGIVTAMIIVLLMPATVHYGMVIVAVLSGLWIGKYVFGGTGNNIFNPAALGVTIVALSYQSTMFRFPITGQQLPWGRLLNDMNNGKKILFASSPGYTLGLGGTPNIDPMSLLLGDFPGMMGTTCVILLISIGIFLWGAKLLNYPIVLSSVVTVSLYAGLFPRVKTGVMESILFELTAGVFLFGIIFMTNDPQTTPTTKIGQCLYGIFLALLMMVFRTVGAIELEFVFVLLFGNALIHEFDHVGMVIAEKFSKLKIKENRNISDPIAK